MVKIMSAHDVIMGLSWTSGWTGRLIWMEIRLHVHMSYLRLWSLGGTRRPEGRATVNATNFQSDTVQYFAPSPSGWTDISFFYPDDQCIKEKVLPQLQPRSVQWSEEYCGDVVLKGSFYDITTPPCAQREETTFIPFKQNPCHHYPVQLHRRG